MGSERAVEARLRALESKIVSATMAKIAQDLLILGRCIAFAIKTAQSERINRDFLLGQRTKPSHDVAQC
jgi:hypothetical protein